MRKELLYIAVLAASVSMLGACGRSTENSTENTTESTEVAYVESDVETDEVESDDLAPDDVEPDDVEPDVAELEDSETEDSESGDYTTEEELNSESPLAENDGSTVYPDGTIGAYLERAGVDIYSLADELYVDEDELYECLNYDESSFSLEDVDEVKFELRSIIINKQLRAGEITLDDLTEQYKKRRADQEAAAYKGERCYIEDNGFPVRYDGGEYYDIKYRDTTTGEISVARLYIEDNDKETCVPVNLHAYYIITQESTHEGYDGLEIKSAILDD
jgi:hypothetical protein